MISYSRWHALPINLRGLLAKQFGFSKVGSTHVVNNRIESDGYNFHEVERALSKENLEVYLGHEVTDPAELWDAVIQKITGVDDPIEPPGEKIESPLVVPPVEPEKPEKIEVITPPKKKVVKKVAKKAVKKAKKK